MANASTLTADAMAPKIAMTDQMKWIARGIERLPVPTVCLRATTNSVYRRRGNAMDATIARTIRMKKIAVNNSIFIFGVYFVQISN